MNFINKTFPPLSTHKGYRPDIDGLRAFAILAVIVFHAFPNRMKGGYVGVDIFFVISGFLISRIIFEALAANRFSFLDFYARRINRIFPALIVVLVSCFVFGWIALLPDEFALLAKHIASGAGFVQNIILMREVGYFDTASELKPLLHLWSLAIEEQYYFLYPFVIWAAWKWRFNILRVIAGLALLSIVLNLIFVRTDPTGTFFLPHTRVWELLVGGILAYLQFTNPPKLKNWVQRIISYPGLRMHSWNPERRQARLSNAVATLGLLLLLASIFGLNKNKVFPGWWALLPVLGALCIIVAGQDAWVNRKLLGNRVMVWVGLISYPLYLWHWSLLSFARIIEMEIPSVAIRCAAIGLSFILAWLTYRLVERPTRGWQSQQVKPLMLCGVMLVVGYLAFDSYRTYEAYEQHQAENIAGRMEFANDCSDVVGFPSIKNSCRISMPTQKPNIILFGDSHAISLFHGLSREYQKKGESLIAFFADACIPLINVEYPSEQKNEICHKKIDSAFMYAESSLTERTFIFSMLGGPGHMYGNKDQNMENRNKAAPSSVKFIENFSKTLDKMSKLDKKIIFIHDWPDLKFNTKLCEPDKRPFLLTADKNFKCRIPRKDFEENVQQFRDAVNPILKKYPNVKVIDASRYLCDTQFCWGKMDGQMLYRDRDHLNDNGSSFVAAHIVTAIDAMSAKTK